MRVLGCVVGEAQLRRWEAHLAPDLQPFFVDDEALALLGDGLRWTREEFRAMNYAPSLRDTFAVYHVPSEVPWVVLLSERTFRALGTCVQSGLLRLQRDVWRGGIFDVTDVREALGAADVATIDATEEGLFVLWPSVWRTLSVGARDVLLRRFLTEDRLEHRGMELDAARWDEVDVALPGVRALAGTFASESGANCLSTVVAAFGAAHLAEVWLHGGPFERWLTRAARQVEALDMLGSVLVWRDEHARVQHAAVSLGGGWVFQKDAQGWFAPRQIVRLDDLRERWAQPGWTLEAWRRS